MSRIIDLARSCIGMGGPEPWAAEMGLTLGPNDEPEHCGIWARAIWRRDGRDVPDWRIGSANTWYLARTTTPQPGDLVEWRFHGHQSLFVGFAEDGRVISIDANTVDDDGNVGVVAPRRRPPSEVLGYRTAPPAPLETADTEPAPPPSEPDTEPGLPPVLEPVPFDPRPLEAEEDARPFVPGTKR